MLKHIGECMCIHEFKAVWYAGKLTVTRTGARTATESWLLVTYPRTWRLRQVDCHEFKAILEIYSEFKGSLDVTVRPNL